MSNADNKTNKPEELSDVQKSAQNPNLDALKNNDESGKTDAQEGENPAPFIDKDLES